jgi:polyhydroxyalkanoate synthesis regulator phasin
MKKQVSAIVDKLLTKGMAIMESEKAQQLLSTPQAQKALDLGMSALTMVQNTSDAFKAGVANKLGLATQKDIDELRDTIARLEAEKADAQAAAEKAE